MDQSRPIRASAVQRTAFQADGGTLRGRCAVSDRDEIELPAWVRPGAQFRMLNQLWHVRAIVDGGPVCRTWRPYKKRWRYEWVDPEAFIGSKSIEQILGEAGSRHSIASRKSGSPAAKGDME
jgi:hypothetical protein